MATKKLYFKYLRNEQNEQIDYQYKPPIYGESNTDISYYEPNATRIANMYKSATSASQGVYDFEAGKADKVDIDDCVVPFGRKLGLTFEEVSQVATYNEQNIINQAKQAEQDIADADEQAKKNLKDAVAMANAINNPDSISVK